MNDPASWLMIPSLALAGIFLLLLLIRLVRQYSPPLDAAESILIGTGYLRLDRLNEALKEGRRAVELDPENPQARALLSGLLLHSGDSEAAERQIREAIRIEPENDAHHRDLGIILVVRSLQKGLPADEAMLEAAWESFIRACRWGPRNLNHRLYLHVIETAWEIPPRLSSPGQAQEMHISPLLQIRNSQTSEEPYLEQLQVNGNLSEAHFLAALFHLVRSQDDPAKRHLRACLKYKDDFARTSAVLLRSIRERAL